VSIESKLVLGQIYRAVKIDKLSDQVIERELKYSIRLDYKLLPWVVDSQNYGKLTSVVRRLFDVNDEIVRPMTIEIKELMSNLSIINEAELFCSDMEYRVQEKKIVEKIIGDNTKKSADILIMCQN
jgi:ribosomal protein S6